MKETIINNQNGQFNDSPNQDVSYKWQDPYEQAQEYANEQMEDYGKETILYDSEELSAIYCTNYLDEIEIVNNTYGEMDFFYNVDGKDEVITIPARDSYVVSENEPEFTYIKSAVENKEFEYAFDDKHKEFHDIDDEER